MELRIPTREALRDFYNIHMKEAFPPAELKPLSAIERMWRDGWYKPYCLYDDGGTEVVGCAFLWLGHDGWGLLDYLCVCAARRNDGLGAVMLRLLPKAEPGMVIFGEAEAPVHAPDPAMAERRLGFYRRCGLRAAGYDTEIFGVHYKTLYLAERNVADEELMAEHRFVYQNSFTPEKYQMFVRIPCDPEIAPGQQVAWDQ
ncbi:MAG: GNAT family N-acetyltransferase [Ruminococcaceae bacterium]|nr:GNAT family N-acetyltransferase [Oscillospiraceae bacterium]